MRPEQETTHELVKLYFWSSQPHDNDLLAVLASCDPESFLLYQAEYFFQAYNDDVEHLSVYSNVKLHNEDQDTCELDGDREPVQYIVEVECAVTDLVVVNSSGHYDEVSNFTTSEVLNTTKFKIIDGFDLKDQNSVIRLTNSDLYNQAVNAFFSQSEKLHLCIATLLEERFTKQVFDHLNFNEDDLIAMIYRHASHLLPHMIDNRVLQLKDYVEYLIDEVDSKTFIEQGLEILYQYRSSLDDSQRLRFVSRIMSLGLDMKRWLLPKEKVRFTREDLSLMREQMYRDKWVPMVVSDDVDFSLVVDEICVDAIFYGEAIYIDKAIDQLVKAPHIDEIVPRIYECCFGRQHPKLQAASEQIAVNTALSVRQAVQEFNYRALLLALKHDSTVDELNKVMVIAADYGCAAIIQALHEAGADLNYWARYSIKKSNKERFGILRQYLLQHGVVDEHFNGEYTLPEWEDAVDV